MSGAILSEQKPHGPPFTVERYGTFGQSIIAERDWLLEEVEKLRAQLAQCRAEYSACIDTVDRLENGSSADVPAPTWTCTECEMRGRPADEETCANCGAPRNASTRG